MSKDYEEQARLFNLQNSINAALWSTQHPARSMQHQSNERTKEMTPSIYQHGTSLLMVKYSMWHSIIENIVTSLVGVPLIGLGWWLDSAAMQWAGFVLFVLSMCFWVAKTHYKRITKDEAIKIITEEWE